MLRFFAPALVLLLLAPTGVAPESPNPNRVANAGFEDDANGDAWPDKWTYDTASPAACSAAWSTYAYAGNRSLAFHGNGTLNCLAYSDVFSAVAGVEYVLTARTAGDDHGGGAPMLHLAFVDAAGHWLTQPCIGQNPYGGGWNEARHVCLAPLGTVGARVVLEGNFISGVSGAYAAFDSVSVRAP